MPNFAVASKLKRQTPGTLGSVLSKNDGHYESGKQDEQRMISLDIAAVTGKMHKHVLEAIRNMEPAWEKECGRKFALTSEKLSMPQSGFAQDRGNRK